MTNADKRRAAGNFGRWLFRFACVISIVAGVSAATPRSSAVAAEVQWQPLDLAAAMHKGAAEGKLIYIFVEGDNCPPCDAFKQTHLTDPAFIDFVNTVYVPLRAHMGQPDQLAFLQSLQLMHPAVPRFYVITADGRPISMSAGMVMAPPMEGAEVLHMAMGRDLPVDKQAAAALADRLRRHAANQRASGTIYPDKPLRHLGVAILEAQAWALAGRLDEAETAFGSEWADQLVDQEVRNWYINFWLAWNRNLPGALAAARSFRSANPHDPAGSVLLARALAANQDYPAAIRELEPVLQMEPDNQALAAMMGEWQAMAGR